MKGRHWTFSRMASNQSQCQGISRTSIKRLLIILSVVALLVATLSATSAFSDTSLKGTIAFSSDRDGDREIYVMDADGGPATQLTFNSAFDGNPDWSPSP